MLGTRCAISDRPPAVLVAELILSLEDGMIAASLIPLVPGLVANNVSLVGDGVWKPADDDFDGNVVFIGVSDEVLIAKRKSEDVMFSYI